MLTTGVRAKKLKKIEELLSGLYCFTSEEIEQYREAAQFFPDDGLDKLLQTLQDGKKQQDEFLAHRVESDKEYVKDLSRFLNKTTNSIRSGYEKSEHEKAESILGKM